MMELYIREVPGRGRGVFCTTDLAAGDEIELCPVIICPPGDREHIDKTNLYNYYFLWGDDQQQIAIALGYGSIYNHAYEPNARYETYFEDGIIRFVAIRDIPANTEITVNYNHDSESRDKVWFEVE
jgi:uncharacterized protein